jgi:hypothetical protein
MARNIPLSQIGNYIEGQYEKLLRAAVLGADAKVKAASPVDTGRLRASWQIGENAANGQGAPATGSYPKEEKDERTVHSALPPVATNYQSGQEKLGNVYSVHNNLPYAEPVLTGNNLPPSWKGRWRSKNNQIEQGYIPYMVAKDMQDFIKKNADRIGRQP